MLVDLCGFDLEGPADCFEIYDLLLNFYRRLYILFRNVVGVNTLFFNCCTLLLKFYQQNLHIFKNIKRRSRIVIPAYYYFYSSIF